MNSYSKDLNNFNINNITIDNYIKKDLKKLDKQICKIVINFIENLQKNPKTLDNHKCKIIISKHNNIPVYFYVSFKLKHDYRIICEVLPDKQTLNIMTVGHRKNVYDVLKRRERPLQNITKCYD